MYLPTPGYWAIGLALVGAMALDLQRRGDVAPVNRVVVPMKPVFWWLILGAIVSVFPSTTLAMYMYFSSVGAESVLGVQGRYFLPPLLLLCLLALSLWGGRVEQLRMRSVPRRGVAGCVAILALLSVVSGIAAVFNHYWVG